MPRQHEVSMSLEFRGNKPQRSELVGDRGQLASVRVYTGGEISFWSNDLLELSLNNFRSS